MEILNKVYLDILLSLHQFYIPVFHVLKRSINAAFKAFVLLNDVWLFLHQALEVLEVLINHVQNVFIQALETLE